MYPDEGTSKRVLLEAGPSRGSRHWMARDFDLEDIVVDKPMDVIQESKPSVAVPKRETRSSLEHFCVQSKTRFCCSSSSIEFSG